MRARVIRSAVDDEFTLRTPLNRTQYAHRLVKELASIKKSGIAPEMAPTELTAVQTNQLTQLLHEAKFRQPSGSCLSPAGEYNLRLGA